MILGRSALGTLRSILGSLFPPASAGAGTAIADAYLEDFIEVPAVGRFIEVGPIGRVLEVPAIQRMVEVNR